MKVLRNKYFILGNILLILLVIPLTLYFISKNQANRTKAAPSTILSMTPASVQAKKGTQFDIKVTVNPGQNIVSIVDMYILFDSSKLKLIKIDPNKDAFQTTLRGPIIQAGSANISLNIGSDVTKAVTASTTVATLTFEALDNTTSGPVKVTFDQAVSRVFSLSSADSPGENVLQSTQPADVTISDTGGTITPTISQGTGSTTPTPTTGGGIGNPGIPTPTSIPVITPTPTGIGGVASASPTLAANQAPICTGLSLDRAGNGTAPFAITLTANGNDPDDTISKVVFDYGDGPSQSLTSTGGIGTANVSASISHTYNNAGTYTASITLIDGQGKASAATSVCQKTITVSQALASNTGGSGGTGGSGTGGGGQPKPTLAPTGSVTTTLGIIGGILLTIIGGAVLLIL